MKKQNFLLRQVYALQIEETNEAKRVFCIGDNAHRAESDYFQTEMQKSTKTLMDEQQIPYISLGQSTRFAEEEWVLSQFLECKGEDDKYFKALSECRVEQKEALEKSISTLFEEHLTYTYCTHEVSVPTVSVDEKTGFLVVEGDPELIHHLQCLGLAHYFCIPPTKRIWNRKKTTRLHPLLLRLYGCLPLFRESLKSYPICKYFGPYDPNQLYNFCLVMASWCNHTYWFINAQCMMQYMMSPRDEYFHLYNHIHRVVDVYYDRHDTFLDGLRTGGVFAHVGRFLTIKGVRYIQESAYYLMSKWYRRTSITREHTKFSILHRWTLNHFLLADSNLHLHQYAIVEDPRTGDRLIDIHILCKLVNDDSVTKESFSQRPSSLFEFVPAFFLMVLDMFAVNSTFCKQLLSSVLLDFELDNQQLVSVVDPKMVKIPKDATRKEVATHASYIARNPSLRANVYKKHESSGEKAIRENAFQLVDREKEKMLADSARSLLDIFGKKEVKSQTSSTEIPLSLLEIFSSKEVEPPVAELLSRKMIKRNEATAKKEARMDKELLSARREEDSTPTVDPAYEAACSFLEYMDPRELVKGRKSGRMPISRVLRISKKRAKLLKDEPEEERAYRRNKLRRKHRLKKKEYQMQLRGTRESAYDEHVLFNHFDCEHIISAQPPTEAAMNSFLMAVGSNITAAESLLDDPFVHDPDDPNANPDNIPSTNEHRGAYVPFADAPHFYVKDGRVAYGGESIGYTIMDSDDSPDRKRKRSYFPKDFHRTNRLPPEFKFKMYDESSSSDKEEDKPLTDSETVTSSGSDEPLTDSETFTSSSSDEHSSDSESSLDEEGNSPKRQRTLGEFDETKPYCMSDLRRFHLFNPDRPDEEDDNRPFYTTARRRARRVRDDDVTPEIIDCGGPLDSKERGRSDRFGGAKEFVESNAFDYHSFVFSPITYNPFMYRYNRNTDRLVPLLTMLAFMDYEVMRRQLVTRTERITTVPFCVTVDRDFPTQLSISNYLLTQCVDLPIHVIIHGKMDEDGEIVGEVENIVSFHRSIYIRNS